MDEESFKVSFSEFLDLVDQGVVFQQRMKEYGLKILHGTVKVRKEKWNECFIWSACPTVISGCLYEKYRGEDTRRTKIFDKLLLEFQSSLNKELKDFI